MPLEATHLLDYLVVLGPTKLVALLAVLLELAASLIFLAGSPVVTRALLLQILRYVYEFNVVEHMF